jgi:pimeloyl-[acyl-carrier protein] methyl ester esterase
MNQGIWQPFCWHFEAYYGSTVKLRCLDLPGFGRANDVDVSPYSLPNIAQWLGAKITRPSVIIAWSLGGLVAQQLVIEHHKHVLAHIQIASTPCFKEQDDWPGIKPNVLKLFAKQLKIDHEALLQRFFAIQNMGLNKPKHSVKQMVALITQYPFAKPKTLEESLELLNTVDLRNDLTISSKKCLRIFGKLDSLVPLKAVEKINELCPNEDVAIIEKASHAPFLSHPEDTFARIRDFLEKRVGLSSAN